MGVVVAVVLVVAKKFVVGHEQQCLEVLCFLFEVLLFVIETAQVLAAFAATAAAKPPQQRKEVEV